MCECGCWPRSGRRRSPLSRLCHWPSCWGAPGGKPGKEGRGDGAPSVLEAWGPLGSIPPHPTGLEGRGWTRSGLQVGEALDGQVWGLLDKVTDVSQPDEKLLLRPWWWSLSVVPLDCREPQTLSCPHCFSRLPLCIHKYTLLLSVKVKVSGGRANEFILLD